MLASEKREKVCGDILGRRRRRMVRAGGVRGKWLKGEISGEFGEKEEWRVGRR